MNAWICALLITDHDPANVIPDKKENSITAVFFTDLLFLELTSPVTIFFSSYEMVFELIRPFSHVIILARMVFGFRPLPASETQTVDHNSPRRHLSIPSISHAATVLALCRGRPPLAHSISASSSVAAYQGTDVRKKKEDSLDTRAAPSNVSEPEVDSPGAAPKSGDGQGREASPFLFHIIFGHCPFDGLETNQPRL